LKLKVTYASEEEALHAMSTDSRRVLFDGAYAVCRLAEHIARTGISIEEIAAMIEPEHKRVREISCDWDDIGRVIKTVYREGASAATEGLRLDVEDGYGYICPHETHPKIIIRTEGFTEEYAEELCEKYTDMVKKILKKPDKNPSA
jgi:mannose-1-phosphate guanylyltransferase/phosphomannomutase